VEGLNLNFKTLQAGIGGLMKIQKALYFDTFYLELEPIDRLMLGPALVVIGTQDRIYRHLIQEQMAAAIATGNPFLGRFNTQKRRVLMLRKGSADYERTEERIEIMCDGPSEYFPIIEKIEDHIRIEPSKAEGTIFKSYGLISYLKKCLDSKAPPDVIFLPDYQEIATFPGKYLKLVEFKDLPKVVSIPKDDDDKPDSARNNITLKVDGQYVLQLKNLIAYHNVKRLRDFANKHRVCIVMGHGLTQNNAFESSYKVRDADILLVLKNIKERKQRVWKFEVVGAGNIVPGNTWGLEYSEVDYFRLSAEDAKRISDSYLSDNEQAIIKALRHGGIMRHTDIAISSDVGKSSVTNSLKSLVEKNIVVQYGESRNARYELNEN